MSDHHALVAHVSVASSHSPAVFATLSSMPIHATLPTHILRRARHPPLPFFIAHNPVLAFSCTMSNPPGGLCLPRTLTLCVPSPTCATAAVVAFDDPRRLRCLPGRDHHLPCSPCLIMRPDTSPACWTPPPTFPVALTTVCHRAIVPSHAPSPPSAK
ncbi:hypothetical protein B0H14DRAFT_2972102 [Mycena olivaceomarginata]|nr:hypothetical protein B0H14DRAFT_2972102 [Mycena olivaceomarginata]